MGQLMVQAGIKHRLERKVQPGMEIAGEDEERGKGIGTPRRAVRAAERR